MRASRLKAGMSTLPDTSGVPCMTTEPSLVRNTLWHAGSDQIFRLTPARRRVSARYGNPPTLGRIAAARLKALSKFSIAWLKRILPIDSAGIIQRPFGRVLANSDVTLLARPLRQSRPGCHPQLETHARRQHKPGRPRRGASRLDTRDMRVGPERNREGDGARKNQIVRSCPAWEWLVNPCVGLGSRFAVAAVRVGGELPLDALVGA